MKAVTLHRPWAYAIAKLGKDIENRTWECYLPTGTAIAIHAGKTWDQAGADWIREELGLTLPLESEHPTGIVAVAVFDGNLLSSRSKWFFGPVGWLLQDTVSLEPVPCNGAQGLWTVPAPQLISVIHQLQALGVDNVCI